jgi:N-acetyl-anhydromuramyl-L-alanine amidase AmpD
LHDQATTTENARTPPPPQETDQKLSHAPTKTLQIVEQPIQWNEQRRKLSLEYLSLRHGLTQEEPVIVPVMVVLHATESATLSSAFHTFDPPKMPAGERPFLAKASALNVSAHFLVDRDGTVVRLLPETTFARHTVGLNWCAIGVENIGGTPKVPLNDAQAKASADLVRHLAARFPIRHLLGHHEYLAYRKTSLWKETSTTYFTVKSDPGAVFMKKVRALLADLAFEPVPTP